MQMLEKRFIPIHRTIGTDASMILSLLVRCMNQEDPIESIQCIFYDSKNRCLVATDGKLIAWVSIDVPALAFLRQHLGPGSMRLIFAKGLGVKGFVAEESDRYPNWKRPIPDYEKWEQREHPFRTLNEAFFNGEAASLMTEIGIPLNIRLLKKLRGFDWTVRFDRKNLDKPVVFKSSRSEGNDVFAALMPIRMDLVRERGLQ